jgi:hypothetical protein
MGWCRKCALAGARHPLSSSFLGCARPKSAIHPALSFLARSLPSAAVALRRGVVRGCL